MAVDLKTAGSAIPGAQLPATQLTTSEAALYTCASGSAFIGELSLTNTSGSDATALVSLVKSGGTGVAGNRKVARTLVPEETAVLKVQMNEGDFLSGKSGTATAISVELDGTVFSNSTGAVLSGIQDDFIGSGGHGTSAPTGTNKIGTAANRWLFGSLLVQQTGGGAVGWASYTGGGPTMSCTDGAMTRLVSIDFNTGAGVSGSVHLFGRSNPTSGSTQTLTGGVAASGATFATVLGSFSKSGVASLSTTASTGPVGAAVLSLPLTSAVGHVPVFAGAFYGPPQDFNLRTRYFSGVTSGFTVPQWLIMADAIGAATVTATVSNSTQHAVVGIDCVPA